VTGAFNDPLKDLARFNSLSQFAPTEIESTRIEKGIFTAEEISKLLEKANLDWRGAILVGYFTGARLKDVCNLRWGNVDLEKMLITFRAGKTGQLITVAIHPELSVVGYNDIPDSDRSDPPLTTFDGLGVQKGRSAARIVFEGGPPRHEILKPQLIMRTSTGPAPVR